METMSWKKLISNNKKIIFISATALIVGLLIGILIPKSTGGHVPRFFVKGDVKATLIIDGFDKYKTVGKTVEGQALKGISIKDILDNAAPYSEDYDVLAVGDDGLSSLLLGGLEGANVYLSKNNGWELINERHPISSNIKHLSQLIVVERGEFSPSCVTVIDAENNGLVYAKSPGQALLGRYTVETYFEGTSQKNYDEKTFGVSVYTPKVIIPLEQYKNKVRVICSSGEQQLYDGAGWLELASNRWDFRGSDGKTMIKDVKTVIVNAPSKSIMDVYGAAENALKNGKDVTVIELDGMGCAAFDFFANKGSIIPPEAWGKYEKASVMFRPVSQPGLAAMLAGEDGSKTGILDRSDREPKTGDIFTKATEMKKTCAYIEGDGALIKTSQEPVINVDSNKNGLTDDEVFDAAMKTSDDKPNLMFVHFHGIDDVSHDKGPYSHEALTTIKQVLDYSVQILEKREGRVIITADHGQHNAGEGGDHGKCIPEDMFVPYWQFEK